MKPILEVQVTRWGFPSNIPCRYKEPVAIITWYTHTVSKTSEIIFKVLDELTRADFGTNR